MNSSQENERRIERQIDLLEKLDGGRRANAERECHEALLGKNRLSSEGGDWGEYRLQQVRCGFGSRRMSGHADNTFSRFASFRVTMRNKSDC
jgi:hypothetical protein